MKDRPFSRLGLFLYICCLNPVIARGFAGQPLLLPRQIIFSGTHQSIHRLRDNANHLLPNNLDCLLSTRGGGGRAVSSTATSTRRSSSSVSPEQEEESSPLSLQKVALWTVVTVALSWLVWDNRVALGRFFDKQVLQERVLTLLHSADDWKGLVGYSCGMAVWELFGSLHHSRRDCRRNCLWL